MYTHSAVVVLAILVAETIATAAPTLTWSQVSVEVDKKPILSATTVHARAGRLLGVLGPSGAGKTTLLSILSGRCQAQRGKRLQGSSYGAPDAAGVSVLEQAPARDDVRGG